MLDDWRATLAFEAGPDIGANGEARLFRANAERRLTLDLAARIEGLLPAPVAPVFAGETRLRGTTRFGDSGALFLDAFELTSRTAKLSVAGTLSADQVLDITARASALPSDGSVTRAGAAEIGTLTFDGRATGPLKTPTVTGKLAAAAVRIPQGTFGRLDADLRAEPDPRSPDAGVFAVRADAKASGVALSDPALRSAVGNEAEMHLDGRVGNDGVAQLDLLRVANPNAELEYRGRIGARVVAGTLRAEIRRLAAFSGLAGRRLSGTLSATAQLDGDPKEGAVRADVDARAGGLSLAQEALDRIIGGRLTLRGVLRTLRNGYAFENLRLAGAFLDGRIDGEATNERADVRFGLNLSDLEKAHPALRGRAALDGRLTGSLLRPDLAVTATAADARALGRPLRDVRLEANVSDALGMLDGNFRVSGAIANRPLRIGARLRRGDNPAWRLDDLEVAVGEASITGQGTLDAAGLADATLRIAADDLDPLSPLVLTPLGGALNATITLAARDGGQDARVVAKGRAVRAFDVALEGLDVDLAATDLRRRAMIDGRLVAERLRVAGQSFDDIRLMARGSAQASDLTVEAKSRGFALSGAARLVPGDRPRLDISRFAAERGRERLTLAQPTSVVLDQGAIEIAPTTITAGSGRITAAGRLGQTLALTVGVRALPLSVAKVVRPDLDLAGSLDADLDLRGSSSRPEGSYRLDLSRLTTPQTRAAGLPPLQLKSKGDLRDGRATIDAQISAGPAVQLAVAGAVPFDAAGPLQLTAKGRVDAALANVALASTGQRVTGRLDVDAALSGTMSDPRVEGRATLAGGSFSDALQGIRLTDIQGRFVGSGEAVAIERLTAKTPSGGTLSAEGRVAVDAQAGFPGSLRIRGRRAQLVSSDLVSAIADLDLTLDGALARLPRVAGRVNFVTLELSVPDRLPAAVQPLPGTRHIAPPPAVRARLAALQKEAAARRTAPAFNANLDLVLSAQNRVFVRGRGLDAELGGDLRLTGTLRDPVAIGAFDLRRGRLSVIGQRLEFNRGRLTFAGDLVPELDFAAETRAGDVTARVVVTGPASQPQFELTSTPTLPQDEVLSRLLFAKASGSLSGFQALQLAQAVAQFAGGGSGPDAFERTRRSLGVDSLDIATGAKGDPTIGASRYIGDRVNVGVKAGARPEDFRRFRRHRPDAPPQGAGRGRHRRPHIAGRRRGVGVLGLSIGIPGSRLRRARNDGSATTIRMPLPVAVGTQLLGTESGILLNVRSVGAGALPIWIRLSGASSDRSRRLFHVRAIAPPLTE